MLTDPVQDKLDALYAGELKLPRGAAHTRSMIELLGPEERVMLTRGLLLHPTGNSCAEIQEQELEERWAREER